MESPGQNIGEGSLSLPFFFFFKSLSILQGIFPTQGSNPGLLCCRQILYQLIHNTEPLKILNNHSISIAAICLLSDLGKLANGEFS